MGAPKRRHSAKHEDAKSVKMRKTGKQGEFKRLGKARTAHEKKHAVSEADESGKLYEEQVDEHSDGEEAELVANTKLTVYDSLLEKLGSRNISVADALRKRQREEQGETDEDEDGDEDVDEDEDEDSDGQSIDKLEEKVDDDDNDDDDEDNDSMSPGSDIAGKDKENVELSEDEDDYDAMSDTDEETTSVSNDQPISDTSSIIKYYVVH